MRVPLTALLTLTATALMASPAQAACSGENDQVTSANIAASEATMVCMVNEYRAGSGRSALPVDSRLVSSARAHSQAMVNQDFFSHDNPNTGQDPFDRMVAAGYPANADMGENIGTADGVVTPRVIFDEFLTSAAHVANMLDPVWRGIGVGFVANAIPSQSGGKTQGATVTQNFGSVMPGTDGGGGGNGSLSTCDQIPPLESKVARLKDKVSETHGSKRKKAKKKLKRAKRALRNARANC